MKKQLWPLFVFLLFLGCNPARAANRSGPTARPAVSTVPAARLTPSIIPSPSTAFSTGGTPVPTEQPLVATVWTRDPSVPILLFHQFATDRAPASTSTKVRLSDFRKELENLDLAGYSLVSFEKWVNGDLEAPAGRHPLILTMDDLFFNNQISLQDDGTPSPETGIGILWQFSQEHPEFGFHMALFVNLGDKLYANPDNPDWQDKLAAAIIWCIEHDAMPYNHTYTHARLDRTDVAGIQFELRQNDLYLRELLLRGGGSDLIPRLGNYLALPYDIWPASQAGVEAIKDYTNPEGQPLQGVLEADYVYREKLLPPPYSPQFDRWHIPRITATLDAVSTLGKQSSQMPTPTACVLDAPAQDLPSLENRISDAIQSGACPPGIYAVQGYIFDATGPGTVRLVLSNSGTDAR